MAGCSIRSQLTRTALEIEIGPKLFELSDDTVMAVIKYRGGCRCQDPGAHPPCSNCTREITDDELLAVEAIDDTTYYYPGGEPNESEKAP